ncbi:MAG TPA: hypothetical protein VG499_13145, partial [Actinomycetota bacterium]|nr:hypothetical protein [Actinomycetota bacterium]
GADAAAELAATQAELTALAGDAADPQPLDPAALTALLTALRAQVLDLAERERAVATTLKAATPPKETR